MTEETRGTDRAGRRAKRFLIPLQKYEIFPQLVRQEVTVIEAADPVAGRSRRHHAHPVGAENPVRLAQ